MRALCGNRMIAPMNRAGMECRGLTNRDLVALVWDGNDCRAAREGGLVQAAYRLPDALLTAFGFPALKGRLRRVKADTGWAA